MVTLEENQIIIQVPTATPADTLVEIQNGIIELMKTILAIGKESESLELDRPTANGGFFALELLQATLFDAETIEAAQGLADAIKAKNIEAISNNK